MMAKKDVITHFYYIIPPEYTSKAVLIMMEDSDKNEKQGKLISEISNQANSILINS